MLLFDQKIKIERSYNVDNRIFTVQFTARNLDIDTMKVCSTILEEGMRLTGSFKTKVIKTEEVEKHTNENAAYTDLENWLAR